jgi:hypothetical protein
MPEWQAIFIGLPFVERDDFKFRKFVWPAQFENYRNCHRPGIGIVDADDPAGAGVDACNVNDFWHEPVGKINNINPSEHEQDGDEDKVFFVHK